MKQPTREKPAHAANRVTRQRFATNPLIQHQPPWLMSALGFEVYSDVDNMILSASDYTRAYGFEFKNGEIIRNPQKATLHCQCEIAGREPSIGFAHNILFDFAVSVYLLDSDPTKFANFVAEQPGRPLFLRPSLVYHFTRLWHFNRPEFWINFWSVIQQEALHLRQIVRLVLPTVIVNEAMGFDDVSPLLKRLENKRQGGNEAVAFLLQAIRILNSSKRELWARFVQSIGLHLDHRFAWDAGLIGNWIVDSSGQLPANALANCGDLGRRLMHWAWSARSDSNKRQWLERLVAFVAVPLIAKTYNTAPDESRIQLERILEVFGEPEFPIDCIYRLTNEIERIVDVDSAFAGTIYERVFGYQEKSDKTTSMGGHVMPMLSNRRQDYGMCRYVLRREYPRFLAAQPFHAIRAGIRAIQAFEIEEHVLRHGRKEKGIDQLTVSFPFRRVSASYVEDGSAIWGNTFYPDQEMQIPRAIFEWMGKAAEQSNDVKAVEAILKESRLKYATVNSQQLNGMSESQLMAYRLMIVPGGNYIAIGNSLSRDTATNIHNAVQSGLNYLGICAGGLLAGKHRPDGVA